MNAATAEIAAKKSKTSGPPIRIVPYTDCWRAAVVEFNHRVRDGKPPFEVPSTPATHWIPKTDGARVYQEMFLAVEGDIVRGAYTFKHQEFVIGGEVHEVGMCAMPISEGIVNKRYGFIAPSLVSNATRRQPLLYGLGFGNLDAPVTQILFAMGWQLNRAVPFYFKVLDGGRFLRNIRYLRTSPLRRFLCDAAALSGLGRLGAGIANAFASKRKKSGVTAVEVADFSSWADEIWDVCRSRYSLIAVRDAQVLETLYPRSSDRFIRLKVTAGQRVLGWAVLLDTPMHDHKHFGNMRVGSIIDCLATPEDANDVIAAATNWLESRGADLLVSNQNHPAWCDALSGAGFVSGPSNFYLVTSRKFTALLTEADSTLTRAHLNRGDGEGPIHL